jgi:hypothetical protein
MSQVPDGRDLNDLYARMGRIAESDLVQHPVWTIAKGVTFGLILLWLIVVALRLILSAFGVMMGGLFGF